MKNGFIGDYLLWDGKPGQIIAEINDRTVVIEMIESCKCPNCNTDLGKERIYSIVGSNQFQENAQKVQTIIEDPLIKIALNNLPHATQNT